MKPTKKSHLPTALIVDDEIQIRRLLRSALEGAGYQVGEAGAAKMALAEIAVRSPQVVILDLGLPDLDGTEALRRLRAWSRVPVLVASVRDHAQDKVLALDAGADDYITKPFDTPELLARLRAIQRRAAVTEGTHVLECGDLSLDLLSQEARLKDKSLKLTPTEFAVLRVLASYPGRIITHAQLLRSIWGRDGADQANGLRVQINGLRKKMLAYHAGDFGLRVVNESGIGYRLCVDE